MLTPHQLREMTWVLSIQYTEEVIHVGIGHLYRFMLSTPSTEIDKEVLTQHSVTP